MFKNRKTSNTLIVIYSKPNGRHILLLIKGGFIVDIEAESCARILGAEW